MEEGIKFTQEALRLYFATDFAQGKDFRPSYQRLQLVKRARDGSTPELRDGFVDHMDDTTFDLCIPYERIAAVYDGMRRTEAESFRDMRMDCLHRALTWYAFHRRQRVSAETFAERVGVNERTVRRWLDDALRHVTRELTGTGQSGETLVFPSSYVPMEALV